MTKRERRTYTEEFKNQMVQLYNELNREFDNKAPLAVVVSDLTYVRVNHKWSYICVLIDLFNREIIGYSTGAHKDASLVYKAFASIKTNLKNSSLFHTDRGNEFKNKVIEDVLKTFAIKRSYKRVPL